MEQFEEVIEMEAGHILNVFGEYDKYVKKLEKYLSVTIVDRDGGVRITGSRKHVEQTAAILNQLLELSKRGNQIQDRYCIIVCKIVINYMILWVFVVVYGIFALLYH